MSIMIYSAIWPYILKCCALKMLWIFLFVIVFISSFLMIMFKSEKEDLKKSILRRESAEFRPQNIHGKINDLKEALKQKELRLTELEIEILSLSRRRESIKSEISKQQEEYHKCMQIFIND